MQKKTSISTAFLDNEGFLKAFLRKFLSSPQDVEDVAQEAYLRAYVVEQSKTIDQPKAFLFTIAKNIALNKLSAKSLQITSYLEEKPELGDAITSHSADEIASANEDFKNYCSAVISLKGKVREAFLLRKVHGSSHKEIAEKMNVSISSVEKYLRQATIALAKALSQLSVESTHSNVIAKTVAPLNSQGEK